MSDHEDYEDYEFQNKLEEPSPGIKIIEAIDLYVPKLTPTALTVLSICIVEDLSLDFPDVKTTLGRALFKLPSGSFQEVLLPQINDLTIINAPTILRLSDQKYTKIAEALASNEKLFEDQRATEWYPFLMQELYEALSEYMLAMPLTVGRNSKMVYRTNFSFSIPPGDKRKINTNFRWPKYFGVPLKLQLEPEGVTVKNKTITAFFDEPDGPEPDLEKIGTSFPVPYTSTPRAGCATIKSDNEKIAIWVEENLSLNIVDQCYGGLFAPLDLESRIQFTILNNTESPLEITEGTKLATMVMSFGK